MSKSSSKSSSASRRDAPPSADSSSKSSSASRRDAPPSADSPQALRGQDGSPKETHCGFFLGLDRLRKYLQQDPVHLLMICIVGASLSSMGTCVLTLKLMHPQTASSLAPCLWHWRWMPSTCPDDKAQAIADIKQAVASKTQAIADNTQAIDVINQTVAGINETVADINETVAGNTQAIADNTRAIDVINQTVAGINETVAGNTKAIAGNTRAIADNTQAIDVISQTVAGINETVAGITQAIAGNIEAIDDNTQAIAANTRAIAANTEAIADNTQAIADNSRGIAANTRAIAANTQTIADNSQAIAANTQAIADSTQAIDVINQTVAELRVNSSQSQKDFIRINSTVENVQNDIMDMRIKWHETQPKLMKMSASGDGGVLGWLVALLALGEVLILLLVCNKSPRPGDLGPGRLSSSSSSSSSSFSSSGGRSITGGDVQGDPEVLSQVAERQALLSEIGIVSFHDKTAARHKELLDSVLEGKDGLAGRGVKRHLVKKHADILELPKTRAILLFVDFNERNVILEDPGQGTGDLRLTAAQAAAKMGAAVFVIYVGDEGSGQLGERDLVNARLTSVSSHPELRRLHGQQRVLSVQKSFSSYQARHLAARLLSVLS